MLSGYSRKDFSRWVLVLAVLFSLSVYGDTKRKSGYDNSAGFAGPGSTVGQLDEEDVDKEPAIVLPLLDDLLRPWFELKKQLHQDHGLQLGIEYTTMYQHTSDEVDGADDHAFSGIVRVKGKWDLLNRSGANKGSLVFSVDNRANYSDTAPASFGGNVGYIGQPAYLFSDADTVLVDLHWQQYINDGKTGLLVGRYDPSDFMHVLGHKSPWTAFQNLNTSLDSSVAYPDLGLGAGIGHWFDKTEQGQIYVMGGFNDANGKVTEEKAFQDGAEFYKFAEIGWTPSREQRYKANLHLTIWHVDERENEGIDDAYGYALGANYTWSQLTMFGQLGFSDADAANDPQIYQESYTVGATYDVKHKSHQAGVVINYGELAADGLDNQTTAEAFFRFQMTENVALTPNVQHYLDPALHADKDAVTVLGLRFRLTL